MDRSGRLAMLTNPKSQKDIDNSVLQQWDTTSFSEEADFEYPTAVIRAVKAEFLLKLEKFHGIQPTVKALKDLDFIAIKLDEAFTLPKAFFETPTKVLRILTDKSFVHVKFLLCWPDFHLLLQKTWRMRRSHVGDDDFLLLQGSGGDVVIVYKNEEIEDERLRLSVVLRVTSTLVVLRANSVNRKIPYIKNSWPKQHNIHFRSMHLRL
jgi:hypothetical protein